MIDNAQLRITKSFVKHETRSMTCLLFILI